MSHPYTIDTGPPKFSPVLQVVFTPVKTDIMENENTKVDSPAIRTHSSISKRTHNLIILRKETAQSFKDFVQNF